MMIRTPRAGAVGLLLGLALSAVVPVGGQGEGLIFDPATGRYRLMGPLEIHSNRPLIFPTEEGTPGEGAVHLAKLGGASDADIFLSMIDGQPGTGDHDQGRMLVAYARRATAARRFSGTSLVLGGWWWDGTKSAQKGIEIENKVRQTGVPELWLEEISGGQGHPFLRFSYLGASNGRIASHDQPGSQLEFQGVNNSLGYQTVARMVGASTPYWEFPQGFRTTSYRAPDGSFGVTVKVCTSFKHGLCVAGTN